MSQVWQSVTESCYKAWQVLQSMAVVTKCDRNLLQSVTDITKCGKELLRTVTRITECDNCYKVRRHRTPFNWRHLLFEVFIEWLKYINQIRKVNSQKDRKKFEKKCKFWLTQAKRGKYPWNYSSRGSIWYSMKNSGNVCNVALLSKNLQTFHINVLQWLFYPSKT